MSDYFYSLEMLLTDQGRAGYYGPCALSTVKALRMEENQ